MFIVKIFRNVLAIAMIGCGGGQAHAALTCSVAGASLSFGNYNDSSAANTDVSAPLSVRCCRNPPGNNATLVIAMGISTNSTVGNKISTRQMKNSANTDRMSYQLYTDSFGGTVWGDGVIGGSVSSIPITVTTNCPTQTTITAPTGLTVFGRIFPLQPVSAGTYGDTVTITVTP